MTCLILKNRSLAFFAQNKATKICTYIQSTVEYDLLYPPNRAVHKINSMGSLKI